MIVLDVSTDIVMPVVIVILFGMAMDAVVVSTVFRPAHATVLLSVLTR